MSVAALYIDPKGPYPKLLGPEMCWDENRDARLYPGPWPVVAHPPCQLWTNMAGVNYRRYGGAHNRPGNDNGCFATALAAVRAFGGVLEHPAESYAWGTFGLEAPSGIGWRRISSCEWTCEVWQSAYGHKARKRTWLLYCGSTQPPRLNGRRDPGTHQCGWFDRNKPTLGKRAASETPVAFAKALIRLAERSYL